MYYGGQLAMIGGALVFGAFRRLVHQPRVREALLLGLGIVIFANSRPYEGLVASIPLAIVLLLWMASKNGPPVAVSLRKIVFPIFLLLAVSAAAMGYYNWRVTGSPIRLPYMVHEAQYDPAPSFIWQQPRIVPAYRHKVIEAFYNGWSMGWYYETLSVSNFLRISVEKLQRAWVFFEGMSPLRLVLSIPLLALPWYFGDRWFRFLLISAIIFAAGLLTIVWAGARLSAPITGALILIYVEGLRRLRVFRFRGRQVGRLLVWAITIVATTTFVMEWFSVINDKTPHWGFERARINRELADGGGRHLIVVRYGVQHSPLLEWVYNEADIDAAKVVWAREMAPAEDKQLIDYFKDRKVWLLDDFDDSQPPRVTEYPRSNVN
jgi:hypothetical protein